MEDYDKVAQATSKFITNNFSTSFGMASRFFAKSIRQDIYNIYGLVRIADEIVDTYDGKDKLKILDNLEDEVRLAATTGYSANLTVHAFNLTAQKCGIGNALTAPFFTSMRMDIDKKTHNKKSYADYIYGSAEVVGLMCLKVFTNGDKDYYEQLRPGASALGAAFQKVNFLRDLAEDHEDLGRFYFPNSDFKSFDENTKMEVIEDIKKDFKLADTALSKLPKNSKLPVRIAFVYFYELLIKLETTSAKQIKQQRIRIPDKQKLWLIVKVYVLTLFGKKTWIKS